MQFCGNEKYSPESRGGVKCDLKKEISSGEWKACEVTPGRGFRSSNTAATKPINTIILVFILATVKIGEVIELGL